MSMFCAVLKSDQRNIKITWFKFGIYLFTIQQEATQLYHNLHAIFIIIGRARH